MHIKILQEKQLGRKSDAQQIIIYIYLLKQTDLSIGTFT